MQEAALQQYFEQMGQLLRQGLRRPYSKEMGELLKQGLLKLQDKDEERIYQEGELRSLAYVHTDRILRRLAPQRKWLVLQFLQASSLIDRQAPIVNLARADLREAILCQHISQDDTLVSKAGERLHITADTNKYLRKVDLGAVLGSTDANLDLLVELLGHPVTFSANLEWASLQEVVLLKTYLRNATLSGADLSGAFLSEADLIQADLSKAYLGGAWLDDAVLIDANLNMANLNRVYLNGAVLVKADLSNADLYEADLTAANLTQANLTGADLSGAILSEANLSGADLSRANLKEATGVTQKQLEEQAISLEETIMPDGSKHL